MHTPLTPPASLLTLLLSINLYFVCSLCSVQYIPINYRELRSDICADGEIHDPNNAYSRRIADCCEICSDPMSSGNFAQLFTAEQVPWQFTQVLKFAFDIYFLYNFVLKSKPRSKKIMINSKFFIRFVSHLVLVTQLEPMLL